MSKRRLARDDEWHYEGDHADDRADVEEWEAQADGTFTKLLLENLSDQYELYFTITKFENDIGFSLIHQESDTDRNQDVMNENSGDMGGENDD